MATYYLDPVNGNDSHAGTRVDSTVDSTADTTHFVDNILTGADDYINGDFFYNVTRGIGSLITDFVAATDTVTLGTAITGMTAGDTYYILKSWLDLDTFTESARSAGDKVIIRRGANQCDDGTDLTFTSDGTIVAPIVIESDYDNAWNDRVDLSTTATATLTFGSKTVTFSADVSSVLAAGDWIYANGDDNREFAYEVASVVTTAVTLYIPYKGEQAGSGRTMYNMQDNPIWNTASGDFQWAISGDDYWKVQGLTICGTDANGNIGITGSSSLIVKDCVFIGNNSSADSGIKSGSFAYVYVKKCRSFDEVFLNGVVDDLSGTIENCYSDGNSITNIVLVLAGYTSNPILSECEFVNCARSISTQGTSYTTTKLKLRNCLLSGSGSHFLIDGFSEGGFEDYNGQPGVSLFAGPVSSISTTSYLDSETTTVRSGGSNKSIKVTPSTKISSIEVARAKIFDLPIYATTSSKTYTVYFKTNDSGEWTADPTASELWIELEAWGHATNNFRKITKSTGVIDFNGSTSWQSLTVTVAPAQAGVAYLRCWYAKTKEASKSNVFYVDPIPVIS